MAHTEIATFYRILKKHELQITKARRAIFMLLNNAQEPITLSELLRLSQGQVNRVSVYRNIELFEKVGIVHRVSIGWKYKIELTDAFTGHHHHLTCLRCGQITTISDEQHIDEFIATIAQQYDFKVQRHQFEVDGYCRSCATARETN